MGLQEYIVTQNGTAISILSIGVGHFDTYQHVDTAQYYQDTPGKLTLKIESKYTEKYK